MASSSTSYRLLKAARSRQGQLVAASVLTTVTASLWLRDPIRNDAAALPEQLSTQVKRQQVALQKAVNPYTPLAWGTNKYEHDQPMTDIQKPHIAVGCDRCQPKVTQASAASRQHSVA